MLQSSKNQNNRRTFIITIRIDRFYEKLNETSQHSDNVCHKNVIVTIYLIFVQYTEYRIKMTHATTLRVWADNKLCEVYCQKVTITIYSSQSA